MTFNPGDKVLCIRGSQYTRAIPVGSIFTVILEQDGLVSLKERTQLWRTGRFILATKLHRLFYAP